MSVSKYIISATLLCTILPAQPNTPTPVAAATPESGSQVLVEPWQTLIDCVVTVNAGKALQYNFTLEAGTKLLTLFQVEGGVNDRVQFLLLDEANYDLYTSHSRFTTLPGDAGSFRGIGKYVFSVPRDGIYHLVLDNGRAWLMSRKITLHVDATLPHETPESKQLQVALEDLYSKLKGIFIFDDFQTSVHHCGVVNAFSNPNITLCVELIEALQARGMAPALEFVYFHELGHTLMKEWGLPLWDNEDAADEFATAFLLMTKQKKVALQAAQWWASQGTSEHDAVQKIWMDDRHSLSPQRARNILRWVDNANEIVPRWDRVFMANTQTAVLQRISANATASDKDLAQAELRRRNVAH